MLGGVMKVFFVFLLVCMSFTQCIASGRVSNSGVMSQIERMKAYEERAQVKLNALESKRSSGELTLDDGAAINRYHAYLQSLESEINDLYKRSEPKRRRKTPKVEDQTRLDPEDVFDWLHSSKSEALEAESVVEDDHREEDVSAAVSPSLEERVVAVFQNIKFASCFGTDGFLDEGREPSGESAAFVEGD